MTTNMGRPKILNKDAVQVAFKCNRNLREEFLEICQYHGESASSVMRKMIEFYIRNAKDEDGNILDRSPLKRLL